MQNPDERLLKHFDMAKLYENSAFEARFVNREVLQNNQQIDELREIENRYEAIEEIGSGGMKRIQRAIDKFTGREVALATIKNIDSQQDVESFLREARLTASLQHQNIIPVYDLGVDSKSRPYFSMKLIEGDNLYTIIKKIREGNRGYRGKYKLRALLDIFLKVCDAVKYAHSCGVVHLDLKPHNIQISEHGEVLLCDWGIARELEDKSTAAFETGAFKQVTERDATLDTFIKGTPGFMAPEQAMGKWDDTGKKTDIFSLGAILYTILTLRVPFESKSVERMIDDTCEGNLIIPTYIAPERDIPEPLESICLKCMEVDRVARYVSVRKLADDIRAWEEGFVTSVEDVTLRGQLRSFYKRNRKACYIASFIFLGFLIFTAFFTLLLYQSKQSADQARLRIKETLEAMMEIEREKAELGKEASEKIVSKALGLIKKGDFSEAKKTVAYAMELNPSLDQGWELLAKLDLLDFKFQKAYNHARKCGNRAFIKTCDKILKASTSTDRLSHFWYYVHEKKERVWKMPIYKAIKEIGQNDVDAVVGFIKMENGLNVLNYSYKPAEGSVSVVIKGNKKLRNIEPLQALTLNSLDVSSSSVNDITSLAGQPLTFLNLYHTMVKDIRAVKGMPLKFLSVEGSEIADFLALKGSPIERIEFGRGKVSLKFLNSLANLKEIEFPKGIFTTEEFKALDKRITLLFRDFTVNRKR